MPGATDNYIGNLGVGGEAYASDSIVSVHYPRVKMTWGADGIAGDVTAANALPVTGTITVNTISGFATEATLAARIPVNGQALMAASVPVTISSNQSALPVTGTFWQATQPVSGTVTVNTISGFATEATLAARIPVNGQALMAASVPVTLASNQSALPVTLTSTTITGTVAATQSGAWNIGSITTLPALPANQSVNVSQINAVTPLMGNGITGTGSQRVTIASDNTAFPVNATLTAETTKVIGTVNIAAAQTVAAVTAITNALPVGANVIGALTANQSVNVSQVAGVATAVGSGISGTGVQRVVLATDVIQPAISEIRAANLHVTATAAVNTAITATLPAAGAGLFHYITSIQLVKLYSVIGVASAAGVVVTSTNLPGTPAWLTEQAAGGAGTAPVVINYQPTTPLKSSAANIATTLVAPAQLQTIWRWNVSYFTAA